MAINLNRGDSSGCSSPRLSFSHDVTERTPNPIHDEAAKKRVDMSLLSSTSSSEFNFCVSDSCPESETFPADDLFYNGIIIPTQMKQKLNSMKQEEITSTTTATILRERKSTLKSFWGFRRSSSLNCENHGYKRSLSSWSMPLLFRSKSTGSSSDKNNCKQSLKNSSSDNGKFMMHHNGNQSVKFPASSGQKPPLLKKSGSGGGGSYVNVLKNGGSVLNVPPPYIAKGTSDLLGFGSLFRNGIREKKSKN